ncbi:MAG TPA: ANTAR domain-containing protein [Casimicrobiaceae bacterium]|jgi:response regulator NasT|nr:ANTAR domain-containing protein [Casimicrobiaceae bacterium]
MLRVMLVDDSQKEIRPLKETLLAAGYDVIEESTSAAELLARVAAVQPDVIIIDSDSPTRDTLEQLSFVSAQQPRPIVLFTEDRDNATIQAALKAGVSAYIVAGMQPERLSPILDVAVARFEQERALRDELKSMQERLAERKVVERAKGILMKQKGVAEDEAFRLMRKLAMDRNRKLLDVAQQIIDVSELLA